MASDVEPPSGKQAGDENFPVGSWLLPRRLRGHVACFYAFARAADDIADDPKLAPQEKIDRLQGFESTLLGNEEGDPRYQKALSMRQSLAVSGVSATHCQDLLAAFKQDAVKSRYENWADVMAYCRLSAAPVGRYLIDLHGGANNGYGPSDALCTALQMINHLQDCGEDYKILDRIYLPGNWMAEADMKEGDLAANQATKALRRVLDLTLDGIDGLLRDAQPLSAGVRSRRLALESGVILRIAEALSSQLRRKDPLAERVVLSKPRLLQTTLTGLISGVSARW